MDLFERPGLQVGFDFGRYGGLPRRGPDTPNAYVGALRTGGYPAEFIAYDLVPKPPDALDPGNFVRTWVASVPGLDHPPGRDLPVSFDGENKLTIYVSCAGDGVRRRRSCRPVRSVRETKSTATVSASTGRSERKQGTVLRGDAGRVGGLRPASPSPFLDRTRESWMDPAVYDPAMAAASTTARLEARLPTDTHALLKRAAAIHLRSISEPPF